VDRYDLSKTLDEIPHGKTSSLQNDRHRTGKADPLE